MTPWAAAALQDDYYAMHPVMRLMDLIFRVVSKGSKGLWTGSDKPKQVSEEKNELVNETMAQVLRRMGWTPPPS